MESDSVSDVKLRPDGKVEFCVEVSRGIYCMYAPGPGSGEIEIQDADGTASIILDRRELEKITSILKLDYNLDELLDPPQDIPDIPAIISSLESKAQWQNEGMFKGARYKARAGDTKR